MSNTRTKRLRARRQQIKALTEYLSMREITVTFSDFATAAGFAPDATGKFNLPPTQATADSLGHGADVVLERAMGDWRPGDERVSVILTGAGPVWGYLAIAHSLHGKVARLRYAAPNADIIDIWRHGV